MGLKQLAKLSLVFPAVLFFNYSALSAEGCSSTKYDQYSTPCYCSQLDLEGYMPVAVFYSNVVNNCDSCIDYVKEETKNPAPVECCLQNYCESKHK